MSVRLRRLEGVESVEVSLNEGRATIRLAERNAVALGQVRRLVEQSGFSPREARVTARGEVLVREGQAHLRVPGAEETYFVAGGQAAEELTRHAGRSVVVEGVIARPEGDAPPAIEIVSVRAAGAAR